MSSAKTEKDKSIDERAFFLKVLDDLVSINTLFTGVVFMGISIASVGTHSLEMRTECDANKNMAERLVFCEIGSFSFFLLSGLLAKTNKFYLYIYENQASLNPRESKACMYMLYVSAYGTMFGCAFLIASMIDIIQIRIGKLSCGAGFGIAAVTVLCVTVPPALLVFFVSVSYHLVVFDVPRAVQQSKDNKAKNNSNP